MNSEEISGYLEWILVLRFNPLIQITYLKKYHDLSLKRSMLCNNIISSILVVIDRFVIIDNIR